MSDWYELPEGGGFSIAGWQASTSDWHDVEKGETPFEDSRYDLADLEQIVFHYQDEQGNDLYYTLYGPWDDYETLADIIDDMLDKYGVE